MCGREEAVRQQPLESLESLVGIMEAALPCIRNVIIEKRVEDARAAAHETAQCVVCLHSVRDTYLNCGHIICRSCSDRIERCPICRSSITTRSRAFV